MSYERLLRTVGAYLDEYSGTQLSVIETPDGFAIRMKSPRHTSASTLLELKYGDLVDRTALLGRRRGRGELTHARPRVLTQDHSAMSTLYQDLLRALGWELDDSSAYNVLLEEIDGAFWISYVALDPDDSYLWRKRSVRLGIPELKSVLRDAVDRRQLPPILRRTKSPLEGRLS